MPRRAAHENSSGGRPLTRCRQSLLAHRHISSISSRLKPYGSARAAAVAPSGSSASSAAARAAAATLTSVRMILARRVSCRPRYSAEEAPHVRLVHGVHRLIRPPAAVRELGQLMAVEAPVELPLRCRVLPSRGTRHAGCTLRRPWRLCGHVVG